MPRTNYWFLNGLKVTSKQATCTTTFDTLTFNFVFLQIQNFSKTFEPSKCSEMASPNLPPSLKPVASYVKLAADNDAIDAVIGYWIRVYIVQKAIKLDSRSPEARSFLIPLMDQLEQAKKDLISNETVSNEMAAQAHFENYATKIFDAADNEDRSGTATIKTVKVYLAASQLFEVLSVFGDIEEEIKERQKYAKYRAALIMKAIKSGEKPPLPESSDNVQNSTPYPIDGQNPNFPGPSNSQNSDLDDLGPPPAPFIMPGSSPMPPSGFMPQGPPMTPMAPPVCDHPPSVASTNNTQSGEPLSPVKMEKAMKYCKYAGSALQYDDVPTAISNLEKALQLLKTGHE